MKSKKTDDLTIINNSACLLAECGEKGNSCWAIQEILDALIESVGPWWIANYLETCENEDAKKALMGYLEANWPAEAEVVEQILQAAHWRSAKSGLEQDFGGD